MKVTNGKKVLEVSEKAFQLFYKVAGFKEAVEDIADGVKDITQTIKGEGSKSKTEGSSASVGLADGGDETSEASGKSDAGKSKKGK